MEKKYHKIAVLAGGLSAEREVSLVSGKGCLEALLRQGYDAYILDPQDKDWILSLIENRPDAVLNALHGRYGEDGTVQGVLESLNIPYSHSGVTASAVAMDKVVTKAILAKHGLPVAYGFELAPQDLEDNIPKIPFPCVIKPINEGSSVGVIIAHRPEDIFIKNLPPEILSHKKIMVETYIAGREVTVAVLQDKALTVTEIIPQRDFYNYESKYAAGGSKHQVPADIPQDIFEKLKDYALQAHHILGCHSVSRTDFRYNPDDSHAIIILEINTQPGMTPTSLVPEQAEYMGIGYDALVMLMTEDAVCQK